MATPGLVATTLLVAFEQSTEAPGMVALLHDLWGHALHVHPLVGALIALFVSALVVTQNGDANEILEPGLFTPFLEFLAHLMAFACGALVPLALVNSIPWGDNRCDKVTGVAILLFIYSIAALIAIAGLLIVERRTHARVKAQPTIAAGAIATKRELIFFIVLGIASIWSIVACARLTGTTEKIVQDYIGRTANKICLKL